MYIYSYIASILLILKTCLYIMIIINILSILLLIYYYIGAELKELVAVLGTCSETLLRDFAALHTTVVQHYHILHGELLKPITTSSSSSTNIRSSIVVMKVLERACIGERW